MPHWTVRTALAAVLAVLIALPTAFAQETGDELVVALSSDPTSLFMPRTADRTASNAAWSLFDSLVRIEDGDLTVRS